MKNMLSKLIMFLFILVSFIFVSEISVSAGYESVCDKGKVVTKDNYFYKCENELIYIMRDNEEKSSYILANREYDEDNQILYVGKVGGVETFYSTAFNYYGVAYDDRGLTTSNNNMWSDMSINGVIVYSGAFNDSLLIDDSSSGFVDYYNEVGTYLIRQFIGGKAVSSVRMIVVGKDKYGLDVISAKYGENDLTSENLLYNNSNLDFEIDGGEYGYKDTVLLSVNNCKMELEFANDLSVNSGEFSECLKINENNTITLTLYNGLNRSKSFKYQFMLSSKNLTIKLEDSVSLVATSSRRIVINAVAGDGNKIDEKYNLYYWSTEANDILNYDNFMANYEKSDNKGNYSSNKGVILRAEDGAYYLYALAKDDNSVVVVRSEEYVIKNSGKINKIILEDVVLVLILCLGAALPIIIYLFVRGKDTE